MDDTNPKRQLYMVDTGGGDELSDYKVFCFNGEPKLIVIHKGRFTHHTQAFYDANWNKSVFRQPYMPTTDDIIDKPIFADEMMHLSRILSQGIPHIRVDWYHANNQLYFGEFTFFNDSGFGAFAEDQDLELGRWLCLSGKLIH